MADSPPKDGAGPGSGGGGGGGGSGDGHTPKLAKDRNCPFCGQAFTSSSLGRHLDLYIRPKNPKPADGIHDVDQIRRMREHVTRRQPRYSLSRGALKPVGTPPLGTPTTSAPPRHGLWSDGESVGSPPPGRPPEPSAAAGHEPGRAAAAAAATPTGQPLPYPFQTPWQSTGVINDIPAAGAAATADAASATRIGGASSGAHLAVSAGPGRAVSHHVSQKLQYDAKHKNQDALDQARAAELALREILNSFRAAKHLIELGSTPFDFDPLSLDFPALTLRCLQAPPTLMSSTPYSTPTSWSIEPPGEEQLHALQGYFTEEFRKWKVVCASTTTAIVDNFSYPPAANGHLPREPATLVRDAEARAEELSRSVATHLQASFMHWMALPPDKQAEIWRLELARSVSRAQSREAERVREMHRLRQETESLRSQLEQLNKLQQPREWKLHPPATFPVDTEVVQFLAEIGVVKGARGVGLTVDDRVLDIGAVTQRAIERWKTIIVSSRTRASGGLASQRNLDGSAAAVGAPQQQQQQQPQQSQTQTSSSASAQQRPSQTTSPRGAAALPQQPLLPPMPSSGAGAAAATPQRAVGQRAATHAYTHSAAAQHQQQQRHNAVNHHLSNGEAASIRASTPRTTGSAASAVAGVKGPTIPSVAVPPADSVMEDVYDEEEGGPEEEEEGDDADADAEGDEFDDQHHHPAQQHPQSHTQGPTHHPQQQQQQPQPRHHPHAGGGLHVPKARGAAGRTVSLAAQRGGAGPFGGLGAAARKAATPTRSMTGVASPTALGVGIGVVGGMDEAKGEGMYLD